MNEEGPKQEHPAAPEKGASIEVRRQEAIQGIRDQYGILFITLVPPEVAQQFGVKNDQEWFQKALGLSGDSKNLKTIDVVNQGLPDTVEETGIIIGGSPWSVYEKENEPWMIRLKEFLREMHARGKPMLGVCFGHQLLASTFGGRVEKNPKGRDFGSLNVDLTDEGVRDPLFEGVPKRFVASESHRDAVTKIPELKEVAVLARNDLDAHQSISYGKSTRSVQFHPEVTPYTMGKIATARRDTLMEQGFFKDDADFQRFLGSLKDTPESRSVLHNFVVKFVLQK
ncbi:MAG: gamma-glutamyl-gamma-aminobutyrate hydrolase family protein [Candidatus Pacebacteria bacterium]|nr:gamma-glutamyl-gamma-aminobutyrate hydrolase family protein [Candidatus Paceibacterota bacterium]